ncbi:MAG TPA: phosphoenolpyruvate--protein phosphotransferase [Stellaceae bacterium]|jgi:phosphotransferase system enzyme I (PtsI)|nr:phosphoenolpyruvate--protein phosphotransferase [Stellaceae bacterium]
MRIDESSEGSTGSEQVLFGIGVSPGIAIGPAYVGDRGELPVSESHIDPGDLEKERARFSEAVALSSKQLRKLKARATALPGSAADEIGYVLDAHLAMLANSRLIRGVHHRISRDRINAERAIQLEIEDIGKTFAAMRDPYLAARIDDIRVVGARLIRNLLKKPYVAYSSLTGGAVVLAEEVTPADTALMDPRRIGGFAAEFGGPESHTAIMARSLGLPAVLGVPGLLDRASGDGQIVVDGTSGTVVIDPSPTTIESYRRRQEEFVRERRHLGRLRRVPAVTRDGIEIRLEANLELPVELEQAVANGAMGLGLVRTEFLYMNREDLPEEEEQYEFFLGLVRGMEGRPVTLRTLDVGGDKLPEALAGYAASEAANPALGLRAIRLSLRERRLLDPQLAAMLRAASEGPVRILLPMISTVGEIRRTREAMEQVARRLRRRGLRLPKALPPLGAMIEVPAAALAADALAGEADFFAVGTNDLIQYTLAIDRTDEQVADLYNPLHPAVLRLVQFAVEAAVRRRIPISICGEIAGEPRYTALLLGLGLRELSMAPNSIPRVKQRVRGLDMVAATRRAHAIMDQSDSGRIAALLDDFNAMAEAQ